MHVRMLPDAVGRRRPQRIRGCRRAGYEVFQSLVAGLVEVIYLHQLLRTGISVQPAAVFHHLRREPASYPGEGVECGGIGLVDVNQGDVDVGRKPFIDGIAHHVRLGEIALASEAAALFAVIVYALRLLFAETQPHEVFHAHGIGIEAERLHLPPGMPPHRLDGRLGMAGTDSHRSPGSSLRSIRYMAGRISRRGRGVYVNGVGVVVVGDNRRDRGPCNEKCRLIACYEECQRNGADLEDASGPIPCLVLPLHLSPPS